MWRIEIVPGGGRGCRKEGEEDVWSGRALGGFAAVHAARQCSIVILCVMNGGKGAPFEVLIRGTRCTEGGRGGPLRSRLAPSLNNREAILGCIDSHFTQRILTLDGGGGSEGDRAANRGEMGGESVRSSTVPSSPASAAA